MQQLEDMLSEQKNLKNKGHSTEDIQCAALMLIAETLRQKDVSKPKPKIGPPGGGFDGAD